MRTLRERFEYVPGEARSRHTRNGLIVILVFAAIIYWMYSSGNIPFLPKGGYTVKAQFATSANVTTNTPVRVKGVEVGKVEKIERGPDHRGVIVTMRINKQQGHFDLHPDARADIYWRTLLGFGFYIQLDPGSAPGKLQGTIPPSRTTTQTELDQLLAAVDAPSRAGMQQFFKQFDIGFSGQTAPGRALEALAPAMREAAPGLDALRGQKTGDLTETVRDVSQLMGVLARDENELGPLIGNADGTLAVTAAKRADLGSILQNAPQTLADTSTTMVRLRTTLNKLDPVADDLRPGARALAPASRALRPALQQLRPLLDDARPLLTDLRPALTSLNRASRSGIPLLKGLEPVFKVTNDSIIPGLKNKDSETNLPVYSSIGPVFATVNDSAKQYDSNGHIQRFNAVSGGARSLGFLPCTPDLQKLTISCSAIKASVNALAGAGLRTSISQHKGGK